MRWSIPGNVEGRWSGLGWLALLLACLLVVPAVVPCLAAQSSIVPERQVQLRGEQPAWKQRWDLARTLVRQERYSDAVVIYQELLAQRPDILLARRELAFVLLAAGSHDEAQEMFEALEREGAADHEILVGLARARIGAGDCRQAITVLERAMTIGPVDDDTLRLAGSCLLDAGDYAAAVRLLEPYLARHPDDTDLGRRLAVLAADRGDDELARRLLQRLAARSDADAAILVLAAQVHARLGLDNLAADYWRRALAQDDSLLDGHRFLAAHAAAKNDDRAAYHHLVRLWQHESERNLENALQLGRLAERLGRLEDATRFYEAAQALVPDDLAAVEGLVRVYAARRDKERTLAMLERYLDLESRPAADKVRQAAQLYADRGLLTKAVRLYQSLLADSPDDPELLGILAHDLLALGRPSEALAMWRHLAELVPERLDIFLAMADLLEKLGRRAELAAVLDRIVALDPGNVAATLRLAELRHQADEKEAALALYRRVAMAVEVPPASMAIRARLAEAFHFDGHAFADYRRLWEGGDHTPALLAACLRTAARAGLDEAVRRFMKRAEAVADPLVEKAVIRALVDLGLFDAAGRRGAAYFRQHPDDVEIRSLYVESLIARQRLPEAEQVLRRALLARPADAAVLLDLTRVALAAGDAEGSRRWLDRVAGSQPIFTVRYGTVPAGRLLYLRRAEVAEQLGKHRQVVAALQDLLAVDPTPLPPVLAVDAAALALAADRPQLARRFAGRLVGDDPLVVLARRAIDRRLADGADLGGLAEAVAGEDRALVLCLADFLLRLGRPAWVLRLATLCRCDDSLSMASMQAAAEARLGDPIAAARRLAAVASASGGWPAATAARLYYRAGRFSDALQALAPLWDASPTRPDYALLQARSLWAAGRRGQALEIYRRFAVGGGDKDPSGERQSFWAWLRPMPASKLDLALAAQERGEPPPDMERFLDGLAVRRWQQRFQREYEARAALERGDLHRAGRLYRLLVAAEPEDDTFLFDLAGIYDRLDRRREAAALYARLVDRRPDYPGLAEALARHRRHRRPRLALITDWGRLHGWDDHRAVSWWENGVAYTFSPGLQHEFTFVGSRVRYRATTDDGDVALANRFLVRYGTSLRGVLALSLAAGRQALDRRKSGTTLLAGRLDGEFGDRLSGYLSFERDVVTDTLASLISGVVREEVVAGLRLDPVTRLRFEADYRFADFSDGNVTEGYRLGVVATVRRRSPQIAVGYHYAFVDSRDTSLPGVVLAGSSGGQDHPYWTPRNYWLNNFTVYYKQGLFPDRGKGGPLVDARWSLGHDANGHARQHLQVDLGWDLADHFSCRAGIGIVTAPEEHMRRFSFSLEYRW